MNSDLERWIGKAVEEYNASVNADFEGYSPDQMHHILNDPFGAKSPVHLQPLSETDYADIPILNQIKFVTGIIADAGELKLTKKGHFPVKVVKEIYDQRFITDDAIENGISKLYKETDVLNIHLTHILLDISGVTKKRHNKLSLTKRGEKLIRSDRKLLDRIFTTFCVKFNMGYFDGYEAPNVGNFGCAFSLILLKKYGQQKRLSAFYADKFLKAFPVIIQQVAASEFKTREEQFKSCYELRFFKRFLIFFNFINHEEGETFGDPGFISATKLFDRYIKLAF